MTSEQTLIRNDPRLQALIAEMRERLGSILPPRTPGQRVDRRARVLGLAITEVMLVQELADLGAAEPTKQACPWCGELASRRKRTPRSIFTVCGPVTFTRSTYRCADCAQSFVPLDDELGLVAGSDCSDALRELAAFLYAEEPVEVAVEHIAKTLGFQLAPSALHRAVQLEGARATSRLDAEGAAAAAGMTLPRPMAGNPRMPLPTGLREHRVGLLQLDGCMLHERPEWRETKLAVISDLGARVCKPPSAREIAAARRERRQPRGRESLSRASYVASNQNLEAGSEFAQRLYAESIRWGLPWADEIVIACDGAPWIPNLVQQLFGVEGPQGRAPKLTFVLDWQHADGHLAAASAALPPESRERWLSRWRGRLWQGDARGLLRALRTAAARATSDEARTTLQREASYFATRRPMLDYAAFRAAGYPLSSGAVEGSVRHVAQSRCKRPGMTWSTPGVAGLLALRQFRLNHRWRELYPDAA